MHRVISRVGRRRYIPCMWRAERYIMGAFHTTLRAAPGSCVGFSHYAFSGLVDRSFATVFSSNTSKQFLQHVNNRPIIHLLASVIPMDILASQIGWYEGFIFLQCMTRIGKMRLHGFIVTFLEGT